MIRSRAARTCRGIPSEISARGAVTPREVVVDDQGEWMLGSKKLFVLNDIAFADAERH
ncbi:hypothetical protein [Nocardia fluminea]|uniref:hypothetical protein n=1 Tax=Nocardia fluminea TaxID=134984 RepID=UPI0034027C10